MRKIYTFDTVLSVDSSHPFECIDGSSFDYKSLSFSEFSKLYSQVTDLGFNFYDVSFLVEQIVGFIFLDGSLQFKVKLGAYVYE